MAGEAVDRVEALLTIPLFHHLDDDELAAIAGFFVESQHRKGEEICRAGDVGDTFYVVLAGELEVWGGDEGERLLSRLGPRDFFGELALVVGGPRSATVLVSRSAQLLSLKKDDFHRYFLSNPKTLEVFSRVICQRLAATAAERGPETSKTVVGVVGTGGLRGASLVSAALACILRDLTGERVLYLSVVGERTDAGDVVPVDSVPVDAANERLVRALRRRTDLPAELRVSADAVDALGQGERFAALINRLCADFDLVVVDLGRQRVNGARPGAGEALSRSMTEFCDVVVRIVRSPRSGADDYLDEASAEGQAEMHQGSHGKARIFEVLNRFERGTRRPSIHSCEPFVLPNDPQTATGTSDGGAGSAREPLHIGRRIAARPQSPLGVPLHRLARKILGRSIGLAFGGGAAFGIAHLGVIEVLENHGIAIDMMAGCSMGSLVAIGYGSGIPVAELIDMAHDLGRKSELGRVVRRDISLLRPGFFTGNAIREAFRPVLADRPTFRHLRYPVRAVATDIETGRRIELMTGSLEDAFRASCSVPIVVSPERRGKKVLVDGAVCDPVPAETVRAMGADLVVAINVVPPLEKGVEMLPSRIYRKLNRFNPLAYLGGTLDMPNLFDIFMNSMQTLQYELGNFKAISADVRINPDLSGFTWVEFYRDRELVEKGREAAERALPAIKRAIAGSGHV